MAALTLNSTRLSTLALGVALALAPPALAGDVSVKLDAGTGFSVKDNTGTTERLRVDEATGNVSRNGALFVHTTGTNNTFVGVNAGNTSTSGSGRNSAFGAGALSANTIGNRNSAVGYGALLSNSYGYSNSAFGFDALRSNLSNGNSAVGASALRTNTSGSANSAVGASALRFNTTGSLNSAVGSASLYSNTTGFRNSALGESALVQNTTGNINSAFGNRALRFNTTGSLNSAVGYNALRYNTTGSRNVAVGQFAGQNQTTGNDNIYLANEGVAAESLTIRIGTPSPGTSAGTHTRAFIAGIRGATTGIANAVNVVIDSDGQLGTVSSSRSVKKDIRDMGDATNRLLDLRPVTFHYKQQQTLPGGGVLPPEYGLIAEEVAEVFPDLVVYDEKGQPFTVKYHEMAPMLLNEMKKEHRANLDQQRTIEAQRQEIAALTTRLARVETRASGTPDETQR